MGITIGIDDGTFWFGLLVQPVMTISSLSHSPFTTPQLGHQRIWGWRGWQIRYTFLVPDTAAARAATPMVLVHGFGASLDQWRHNLVALSQKRPVYAIDLLGFGSSQKPANLLGASVWQAQLYDFWQALIGRPAIVVGHSLGALVALTASAKHPDMVARLILLTVPLAREELVSGWLDTLSRTVESWVATPLLLRPLFLWVRRPGFIRTVLRKVYIDPAGVDDELVESFTRPTLERGAARTLCYLVRSRTEADFSPPVSELVPQVKVPILLLWGSQDQVIPIGWAQQVKGLSPLLTYQEIPGAGHCLYDEAAETVINTMESWLG
ncbi:MAG: alpha/beta fold hydrolase [Cyanobacteria bacterium J06632_22]